MQPSTTRQEHATNALAARLRDNEGGGALNADSQLVHPLVEQRPNVIHVAAPLQQVLGVIRREAALTLQCFAQTTRTERDIPHQDGRAILEQVHVGGFVAGLAAGLLFRGIFNEPRRQRGVQAGCFG